MDLSTAPQGNSAGQDIPVQQQLNDATGAAFARPSSQRFANHASVLPGTLTISKIAVCTVRSQRPLGKSMSGMAVLENVRRYRTIASLYRQTAAFRPAQKWSLLAQAYEYERLAITELEAHYMGHAV
jgi:hypothetical protein